MAPSFRPLSPAIGVEVLGIDLHRSQPETLKERVRQAYLEHHLVLVRGQELALDQQIEFAEWFGAVLPPDRDYQPAVDGKVETYMSNVVGPLRFTGRYAPHRDDTHRDDPCRAMTLYAQEVSSVGGLTRFYSAEAAYQRLPAALRARLDRLRAVHIAPGGVEEVGERQIELGYRATGGSPGNRKHQTWPVVLEHPATGRPVLYVDPVTVYGIEGMDLPDSDALLAQVLAAFDDPDVRFDLEWRVHDVIVWDNVSLLHERTPFPPTERRTLRKLLIGDRRPALVG